MPIEIPNSFGELVSNPAKLRAAFELLQRLEKLRIVGSDGLIVPIRFSETDAIFDFKQPADDAPVTPIAPPAPEPDEPMPPLTGLKVWFDASDASNRTLDGSNRVTLINDKSGNGFNGVPLTLGPQISAASLNGLDTMSFASHFLKVTSLPLSTFSILCVFRTSGNGIPFEHSDNANSDTDGNYCFTSNNAAIAVRRSSTWSAKNLSSNWGSDNSWRIVAQHYEGTHATHKLFINGVNQSLSDLSFGGFANDPGTGSATRHFYLGGRADGTNGITGGVAELLVYSPALTGGDLAAAFSFLGTKWGI